MIITFLSISFNNFCQELQLENDSILTDQVVIQESTIEINEWDLLISAIMQIESGHNKDAYNKDGKCAGILQITPVLVAETNRISLMKRLGKKYTLDDRFDISKSVEMFNIIQDFYNKDHNYERAIRLWNGGPGYGVKSTQRYYEKVISEFERLKNLK